MDGLSLNSIEDLVSSEGVLDTFDLGLDNLFAATSSAPPFASDTIDTTSTIQRGDNLRHDEYEFDLSSQEVDLLKPPQIDLITGLSLQDQIVSLDSITPQSKDVAEYGTIELTHDWSTITFENSYRNPVVIAGDPTFNGGDPVAVRLRNIRGANCQIRLQEPNYKDGYHTTESVSYVVVETGEWQLLGGERFSAGLIDSNKLSSAGFETVTYSNGFPDDVSVFTQVQTFNGSDWVTTRTKDLSSSSFQVTMQEEENLNNGAHVSESIGWLATDTGGTTTDGINTGGAVTTSRTGSSAVSTYDISDSTFSSVPMLIAKVSSFYGRDTANARISGLTSSSVSVVVHEEQSSDSETYHLAEDISYLAISDGDNTGSIAAISYMASVNALAGTFAEWGTLSINHEWTSVDLTNTYRDPVVIASDPTFNGSDPATVRIKGIDQSSFEIRLQEPNYMDGSHAYETVSYLVVESGDWSLNTSGTSLFSAGTVNSSKLTSQGFESVSLTGFSGIDYTVLTQVQTFNGPDWVTTRTKNLTSSSFQVSMQEEESLNGGGHINEEIGWIAIKEGYITDTSSNQYRSNYAEESNWLIDHNVSNGYIPTFVNTPISILAKLGSYNGGDSSNVRVSNISGSDFYLRVHEDQSSDQEILHVDEVPAYLVLPGTSGSMTGIRTSAGWSSKWGYGHASASRSFEELLGIDLTARSDYGGTWWGLDNVDAADVWSGTGDLDAQTGSGITVAVVDSGVDLDHSEFSGRIVAGYDFVNDDSIADDDNGHGTHVAGTIAAANDGTGIIGVAYNAKIMPIKVLNAAGSGTWSDVAEGIRWAADNGADVINLSLGGGSNSLVYSALQYATGQGSVCVMASGNDYGYQPGWPARYATDYGIAVGATTSGFAMSSFSNWSGSTRMDYVCAPGQYIYSSKMGGGYEYLSGTSMAAPHVAGIAALLKGYDNNLTPEKIERLISAGGSRVSGSSQVNHENYFSNLEFEPSFSINSIPSDNHLTDFSSLNKEDLKIDHDELEVLSTELLVEEENISMINQRTLRNQNIYDKLTGQELIEVSIDMFMEL